MTDQTILQDLYDCEINFTISCFFDGGFHIRLGDVLNGFKAEARADTYAEAVQKLLAMALKHHPRSTFAQKYTAGAAAAEVASPSLVPEGFNTDVYVVLDDFGSIGRSYREIDEDRADRETLIRDLIAGQYEHPARIVAFNTAQGWARDVSEEIAREIRDRASRKGEELGGSVQAFVEWEMERAERREAVAHSGQDQSST
jgi:hypothetical protein